jgi:UDP-GlcNAc:undecaprenyl-phosphate GlcNAc-1-phosphate transferase
MLFLSTWLMALFVTVSLIPVLKTLAIRYNAVDVPDARKVHVKPIPRVGGLAMAVGVLAPVLLWAPLGDFGRALAAGAGIIVLFGGADDLMDLRYRSKFLGQVLAALVVIAFGGLQLRSLGSLLPLGVHLPVFLAVPLTCLFIVGVTNAINLSDGLDGLAGGIAALSFGAIGLLCYQSGLYAGLFVAVAVMGAIFGFLRFNTHPAVIFMGDTGSQLLGFLAVCLAVWVTQQSEALSPVLPVVLLGFPILDTLTVMTERVVAGRSPFKPDRNHFHHKLMRLGLYHSEAVFAIYVLQALLVTLAYLFRFHSDWLLLTAYGCFAALVLGGFTGADRFGWKLPRFHFIDAVVKGRLKRLKDRQLVIRTAFPAVEWTAPVLILVTCLIVRDVPAFVGEIALVMANLLVAVMVLRPAWMKAVLRISLYLLIPFVVYQCEGCVTALLPTTARRAYNLAYGVLVCFVFLTLKFTRRRKGFHATPMDFLVLFLALVVPNLPDHRLQSFHMGVIATRIIALLFSYEVLVGELRGKLTRQGVLAAAGYAVVALKGLL